MNNIIRNKTISAPYAIPFLKTWKRITIKERAATVPKTNRKVILMKFMIFYFRPLMLYIEISGINET